MSLIIAFLLTLITFSKANFWDNSNSCSNIRFCNADEAPNTMRQYVKFVASSSCSTICCFYYDVCETGRSKNCYNNYEDMDYWILEADCDGQWLEDHIEYRVSRTTWEYGNREYHEYFDSETLHWSRDEDTCFEGLKFNYPLKSNYVNQCNCQRYKVCFNDGDDYGTSCSVCSYVNKYAEYVIRNGYRYGWEQGNRCFKSPKCNDHCISDTTTTTPEPTGNTPPPTGRTPEPTGVTQPPTDVTPAPTDVTPAPVPVPDTPEETPAPTPYATNITHVCKGNCTDIIEFICDEAPYVEPTPEPTRAPVVRTPSPTKKPSWSKGGKGKGGKGSKGGRCNKKRTCDNKRREEKKCRNGDNSRCEPNADRCYPENDVFSTSVTLDNIECDSDSNGDYCCFDYDVRFDNSIKTCDGKSHEPSHWILGIDEDCLNKLKIRIDEIEIKDPELANGPLELIDTAKTPTCQIGIKFDSDVDYDPRICLYGFTGTTKGQYTVKSAREYWIGETDIPTCIEPEKELICEDSNNGLFVNPPSLAENYVIFNLESYGHSFVRLCYDRTCDIKYDNDDSIWVGNYIEIGFDYDDVEQEWIFLLHTKNETHSIELTTVHNYDHPQREQAFWVSWDYTNGNDFQFGFGDIPEAPYTRIIDEDDIGIWYRVTGGTPEQGGDAVIPFIRYVFAGVYNISRDTRFEFCRECIRCEENEELGLDYQDVVGWYMADNYERDLENNQYYWRDSSIYENHIDENCMTGESAISIEFDIALNRTFIRGTASEVLDLDCDAYNNHDDIRFLPDLYTLFTVARRTDGTNTGAIFSTINDNTDDAPFYSGFGPETQYAFAKHGDTFITNEDGTDPDSIPYPSGGSGPTSGSLPDYGILISTDQASLYRANGVDLTEDLPPDFEQYRPFAINGRDPTNWDIFEIMVFRRELTLTEICCIEKQLAKYYNIYDDTWPSHDDYCCVEIDYIPVTDVVLRGCEGADTTYGEYVVVSSSDVFWACQSENIEGISCSEGYSQCSTTPDSCEEILVLHGISDLGFESEDGTTCGTGSGDGILCCRDNTAFARAPKLNFMDALKENTKNSNFNTILFVSLVANFIFILGLSKLWKVISNSISKPKYRAIDGKESTTTEATKLNS